MQDLLSPIGELSVLRGKPFPKCHITTLPVVAVGIGPGRAVGRSGEVTLSGGGGPGGVAGGPP